MLKDGCAGMHLRPGSWLAPKQRAPAGGRQFCWRQINRHVWSNTKGPEAVAPLQGGGSQAASGGDGSWCRGRFSVACGGMHWLRAAAQAAAAAAAATTQVGWRRPLARARGFHVLAARAHARRCATLHARGVGAMTALLTAGGCCAGARVRAACQQLQKQRLSRIAEQRASMQAGRSRSINGLTTKAQD